MSESSISSDSTNMTSHDKVDLDLLYQTFALGKGTAIDLTSNRFTPPGSEMIAERNIVVLKQAPASIETGATVLVQLKMGSHDDLIVLTSVEAFYARFPEKRKTKRRNGRGIRSGYALDLVTIEGIENVGIEGDVCSKIQRKGSALAHIEGPYLTVFADRSVRLIFKMAVLADACVVEQKQQAVSLNFMSIALQDPTLIDPAPYTASPIDLLKAITRQSRDFSKVPEFAVDGLRALLLPYQRESVQWALRREGKNVIEGTNKVEDLDEHIRNYVVSPALGWRKLRDTELWINPYELKTSSMDPLPPKVDDDFRGKGLLSEEMGLGKTIEMISVILMHPRPSESFSKDAWSQVREVPIKLTKLKATLVIVPRTILRQWDSEIAAHSPRLKTLVMDDPFTPVERLQDADVVFVTYRQLSLWFQYTHTPKGNALRKSRRLLTDSGDAASFDTISKKTPTIMEVQFWRVILDEVQMVHNGISGAAMTASRIERVHAWAVSGTPVKQSLDDMKGIFKFLRITPFTEGPSWKRFIASSFDIERTMQLLAMRHTKPLVSDQLHIPPQQRKLVLLKFSAIERYRYSKIFEDFEADAMNPNCNLHVWLLTLRHICSFEVAQHKHAAAVGLTSGEGSRSGNNEVTALTLDEVLEQQLVEAEQQVWHEELRSIALVLEMGQLLDLYDQLPRAISEWKRMHATIEGHIQRTSRLIARSSRDQKKLVTRIRATFESTTSFADANEMKDAEDALVDKVLFGGEPDEDDAFESNAQNDDEDEALSNLKRELIVTTNTLRTGRQRLRTLRGLLHRALFYIGTGYFRISQRLRMRSSDEDLEKDEATNTFKNGMSEEVKYYGLATNLRESILQDAENKVLDLADVESAIVLTSVTSIVNIPKAQVVDRLTFFANELSLKLGEILSQPLMDDDEDQGKIGAGIQGETDAYSKTLELQQHAFIYLEMLQLVLRDRTTALIGGNVQTKFISQEENEYSALERELLEKRDGMVSLLRFDKAPLLTVMKEVGIGAQFISKFHGEIKVSQDCYNSLRDLYNARVDYYKQLQDLSDQVKDLQLTPREVEIRIKVAVHDLRMTEKRLNDKKKTLNYLHGLDGVNQSKTQQRTDQTAQSGEETETMPCSICLDVYSVGALTPCGHIFCTDCLKSWLDTRTSCPLCSRTLMYADAKTFMATANPEDRKLLIRDVDDDASTKGLFAPMSFKLYNYIHGLSMRRPYGVKIDMIVKHVKYLRAKDPTAQIVVFSQWAIMLKVLQAALEENQIRWAAPNDNVSNRASRRGKGLRAKQKKLGVNEFRTDVSVACLLLHAKADVAGLTLVNANHVFLCEPLMNTALELQAVSRINRIGQTRETTAWQFCVEDTVEQKILGTTTKQRLLQLAVDGSFEQADSATLTQAAGGPALVDQRSGAEVIGENSSALRKLLLGAKAGANLADV